MLPDGGGVPGGQGCIAPGPQGGRAATGTRHRWSCVGAAGTGGVRPGWCVPTLLWAWWLAYAKGGLGDLAGRKKTGSVLDKGRLPELVEAAARTHADV